MNPQQMTRRSLLAMVGLSLRAADAPKPNVLFIAVDDLRPELGCYGVEAIRTPNVDRIAKWGVAFRRAYCQQAVCSPSRTSLLTGARPDTTKVWDLVTHFRDALPNVVTLPEHFKQQGYFVQGMGKLFHPSVEDPQSWSVPWQTPKAVDYALADPAAKKLSGAREKKGKKAKGPVSEAADVPDNTFKDGKLAELAVATLRDLKAKGKPFFLAVGFAKPHLPFVAPKRYWDMYDPKELKPATNNFYPKGAPDYAVTGTDEALNYHGMPPEVTPELGRHLKHGYYAAVSYMDAQLGKVLDELDRSGLRQSTIIVLWGDHGWKLGEHGAWAKHTNVENDTNAPLLVAAPGLKTAGSMSDALVEFVDVYPTLAELAGLPLPKHLEGVSFKPVLVDPKRKWKPAVFSQYPRGQRLMGYSMRTERYRFTVWVGRKDHSVIDAVELYDHRTDPQENTNIAKADGNAELVKRLMEQWRQGWQGAQAAAR
ncbi:MAG: sulfatase [Acidobacteria bacterium]|nr:sulfatase [Acidobacteriota bacterium]